MEWKLSVCRPYVCYSIAVGRADHASSVLFLSKLKKKKKKKKGGEKRRKKGSTSGGVYVPCIYTHAR